MENQYYMLFLAVLLIVSIFKWINYLSINKYIVECFQQSNQTNETNETNQTSHTVDMPLTTTYSCSNFCGPTSRCAKTGQQCFTDIDCPGCQPKTNNQAKNTNTNIVGDNAAGKLTFSLTPQYSTLTTDIGTKAMTFLGKDFSKTPSPTFGINTWRDDFDAEQKLFNKRYKPPDSLQYMPSYPQRYSVTGDFIENGPLASNALLK
jgi:hypothetical protein